MIIPNTPAPKKFQKFTAIKKENTSGNPKSPSSLGLTPFSAIRGIFLNRHASTVNSIRGTNCRVENILPRAIVATGFASVSYTHLRAHETDSYLVCRLLLEKKQK